MKLMILNGSSAATVVTVVDVPGVEELGAQAMTTIDEGCKVVVVGDKPGLADELEKSSQTVAALLRKVLLKIHARQLGRAVVEPEPVLYLSLANNGKLPIRVTLGDGLTHDELPALGTMKVECQDYIELRELGQQGEGGTG
jgi:hypothetical protein